MKKELRTHSTPVPTKCQVKILLINYLPQCANQQSNCSQTDIFNKLAKCLVERDNQTLVALLKEYPELIHTIDRAIVIRFPPMGRFRIFLIAGKHILYEEGKYIFSSYNRDIAERNQKEWHHHYEQQRKITKQKNPSPKGCAF